MSVGLIYITASPDLVDVKLVNKLLFFLHDWEYNTGDNFHIQWTRDMPGLEESIDIPPLLQLPANNNWSSGKIEEVTQLALKSIDLLLILDDKGIQEQTIIVAQTAVSTDGDFGKLGYFNKVRVPWPDTYLTWCNLDIGNMSFEEFCVESDHVCLEHKLPEPLDWFTYTDSNYVVDVAALRGRDEVLRLNTELDLV